MGSGQACQNGKSDSPSCVGFEDIKGWGGNPVPSLRIAGTATRR